MTHTENATKHRVVYGGSGYGYSVVTGGHLGDSADEYLRVVSGPYTTRAQAQAAADRWNRDPMQARADQMYDEWTRS